MSRNLWIGFVIRNLVLEVERRHDIPSTRCEVFLMSPLNFLKSGGGVYAAPTAAERSELKSVFDASG